MGFSKVKILLVEDNLADAKLSTKLFTRCEGIEKDYVDVAEDGEQAWEKLNNNDLQFNLVFLDLNLPKINGLELLTMIRESDKLCHLPVIILSSSIANSDMKKAFSLRANAYLKKPADLIEYQALMKKIDDFWFQSCKLPEVNK